MLKLLSLIFMGVSLSTQANERCMQKIFVEETRTIFKANVLMPKIETKKNNINIYVTCNMYKKARVGDVLYLPEDIKKFNEKALGVIPYGTMERASYKVLQK